MINKIEKEKALSWLREQRRDLTMTRREIDERIEMLDVAIAVLAGADHRSKNKGWEILQGGGNSDDQEPKNVFA